MSGKATTQDLALGNGHSALNSGLGRNQGLQLRKARGQVHNLCLLLLGSCCCSVRSRFDSPQTHLQRLDLGLLMFDLCLLFFHGLD